jgi:hypothetical protein
LALTVGSQKGNKSNIFQKLPRLSTAIWLLIVSALFLIVAIPMFLSFFSELSTQTLLKSQLAQLQTRYNDLQKQTGSQAALLTEVTTLKSDIDKSRLSYRNIEDSIEVSQALIDLAWKYDITINNLTMSQGMGKYSGLDYPVLTYVLDLTGQVPAFQNFLLAVGNKLPSSEAVKVVFSPAVEQGQLDKAAITIRVVCNKR